MANFNHKKNPVAKYDINTFQQLLSIIGRYQILRRVLILTPNASCLLGKKPEPKKPLK